MNTRPLRFRRFIVLTAFMVLGLLAACDKDNTSNTSSTSSTSTGKSSKSTTNKSEGGCKEFIEATQTYCTEAMKTGRNIGCQTPIMGIHTAMDQAEGNVFDLKDNNVNKDVAEGACRSYHDMLRKDYAKATVPTNKRASIPAQCVSLRTQIKTLCFDPLGVTKVSDACSTAIRAVIVAHDADEMEHGEICELRLELLKQE
ncbi:MAG: hypothetical protein H0U74_00915 [Bradymonadaceae bacterium]|nr:hypothetical protein [Lujinxingiaceae bacterium]